MLGHFYLGFIDVAKQKYDEAIDEFTTGAHFSNNGGASAGLAYGYAMAGKREEAMQIIKELKTTTKRGRIVPYRLAAVYVAFYESDCQGRFFSLLIAFRLLSLQSAPTDQTATIARQRGWAEQSYAADSSSSTSSIHSETISSAPAITVTVSTTVLSETRAGVRPAWPYRFFWSSEGACG